jgi:hypothetical protein
MNQLRHQNRGPGRPDSIAAAVGVLVMLGWIVLEAPPRESIYLADSSPALVTSAPATK